MSAVPRRSMRAAINAFCKGCIYDRTQPGAWRQQVEACTSKSCALFAFGPLSAAPLRSAEQPDKTEAT